MPSMNGRIVPPGYPPPFDGSWGVWPHCPPWWPQWSGAVDPLPPWVNQPGPAMGTRGPLTPEGFPAVPSAPSPSAESPVPSTPTVPSSLQAGLRLAATMLSRASGDIAAEGGVASPKSRVLMATASGFIAGALSAQGQPLGLEYLTLVWNQSNAPDASGLANTAAQIALQLTGDAGGETRRWQDIVNWVRNAICELAPIICGPNG